MEDSLPTQSIVQSARDAMSQSPLKRKASPDADGDSEVKRHQPTAIKTDKDDFDISALNALLNDSVAAALASFPDNSQPTHDSAPTNSKEMAVTDDKNVYTQSNELMRLQSLPILKSVVSWPYDLQWIVADLTTHSLPNFSQLLSRFRMRRGWK